MTGGDPCGIGPEVILKTLSRPPPTARRALIIGDLAVFERAAQLLKRRLPAWAICSRRGDRDWRGHIGFLDLGHRIAFAPGKATAASGRASLDYLDVGIELVRRRAAGALVTAPVTKWAIHKSQPGFQGQTEYLAEAFGSPHPVMMFASPTLRVVLLTRHVPLRDVAARVTRPLIERTIDTVVDGLRTRFHIREPRLAVCGLNPHAGEDGLFGREEQRVLRPAMSALRARGIQLEGPFPADGFFADPSGYDAVICWYHDQGLIPFKQVARDIGCQVSLGLPVVRVSPDHGSALDIAGKNVARPGSMRYALKLATELTSVTRAPVRPFSRHTG